MCADSTPSRTLFLLTCEHAGNEVPPKYSRLFDGADQVLDSHRGLDIGALGVAMRMASSLSVPLVFSTTTRLLIDLNRSLDQPDVFSEFTRELPDAERRLIIDSFYTPHRDAVTGLVHAVSSSGGRVVHVGVHSCTDVLHGQRRELDVALLFDPARPLELAFCEQWRASLLSASPGLRCPFNEPYMGTDDGLTTTLRSHFAPESYLGIEVEVRQGLILKHADQSSIGELAASSLPR